MRFNLNNQIKNVTKSFFTVLKWVGLYYFDEAPCWNLQYDYDAAPFISDISDNFEQFFEIEYEYQTL
jgi:5'-3' exonuclease